MGWVVGEDLFLDPDASFAAAQAVGREVGVGYVLSGSVRRSGDRLRVSAEVAETAPKIKTITIPIDKIGEVIGPKGKVINTIQQ